MKCKGEFTNIGQFDGFNDSDSDLSKGSIEDSINDNESDMTEYDTDDELDPQIEPISLTPKRKPNKRQLKMLEASSLPLLTVLNARSLYNKNFNLKNS